MASEIKTPKGHIVLMAQDTWSHSRPLCILATKIVCARDICVTLVVSNENYKRAEAEVRTAVRQGWLRLVGITTSADHGVSFLDGPGFDPAIGIASFETLYGQLAAGQPIVCAQTKKEFPAAPIPRSVVVDFFLLPCFQIVRNLSKESVKTLAFVSSGSNFAAIQFAPEAHGGVPDVRQKIEKEVEATGKPLSAVAYNYYHDFGDEVIHLPGLPKMHHYERDPCDIKMLLENLVGPVWMSTYTAIADYSDGIITVSPEVYEPEVTAQIRRWMKGTGRELYAVGPLLQDQERNGVLQADKDSSKDTDEVYQLLNTALSEHGEKSVLYISFGTTFWPFSKPDTIWTFLGAVMEKKIPFILSHSSPLAQIPEDLKAKVAAYGNGVLTKWAPQQTILAHPALGWFLTHCGQSSVVEAIAHSVPLICWPYHADQPFNASQLSDNLNVAYELFEIRSGKGLLPIHRTGRAPAGTPESIRAEALQVLENAFGNDGAKKRENMKKLQKEMQHAWDEKGSATLELNRWLDAVCARS